MAVLSNLEGEPVKAIACDLAALAFGTHQPVLDHDPAAAPDPSQLDLIIGSYVGEDGETRKIVRQGDHLTYQRGSASYPLIPIGFRRFALEVSPGVALNFEGPSKKPAVAFEARSCGSMLFSARRRNDQ